MKQIPPQVVTSRCVKTLEMCPPPSGLGVNTGTIIESFGKRGQNKCTSLPFEKSGFFLLSSLLDNRIMVAPVPFYHSKCMLAQNNHLCCIGFA